MTNMKKISMMCEQENLEKLTEYLDGNMNMAIGFMLAHKEMRMKSKDNAYKVLNNIHDKLQKKV